MNKVDQSDPGSAPLKLHTAEIWNQNFATADYIFGTAPNGWLAQHAQLLYPDQRVLCVADGEGRNSVWLAQQGLVVDAFDVSDVGVEKARRLAAVAKVQVNYTVADCDAWPWPEGTYDRVVGIFVQFAEPVMRARLFANMIKTLKPGGLLMLLGYTPKQFEYKTGGPSLVPNLYTTELLQQAFASLEILELQEFESNLSEGARHVGPSALIGLVAKKPSGHDQL